MYLDFYYLKCLFIQNLLGESGPFVVSSIHGSAGGTCSHLVDVSVADDIKQLSPCVAEFQWMRETFSCPGSVTALCHLKTRLSLVICAV